MTVLELFLAHHPFLGYAAVFVGMLLEGEAVFLTAAIVAEEGYLHFGPLITVSMAGVFIGDWLWYWFGWFAKGTRIGAALAKRFSSMSGWLNGNFVARYQRTAIVSKYIYFVNRLTPFLAGWHRLPPRTFFKNQFIADSIWITVMALISQPLTILARLVGVRHVVRRIEFVFVFLVVVAVATELALRKRFVRRLSEEKRATQNEPTL